MTNATRLASTPRFGGTGCFEEGVVTSCSLTTARPKIAASIRCVCIGFCFCVAAIASGAGSAPQLRVKSYDGVTLPSHPPFGDAVDYIVSDGGQYIDTGLFLNQDMDVTITFSLEGRPPTGVTVGLFGARQSSADSQNISVHGYENSISGDFCGGSNYNAFRVLVKDKAFDPDAKYQVRLSRSVRSITNLDSGEVFKSTTYGPEVTTLDTATIFKINGISNFECAKMRLYGLNIKEHGEIIRNYQPALTNGVPVLYEGVTGEFYGNAGTGVFGYGQIVSNSSWSAQSNASLSVDLLSAGEESDTCGLTAYWWRADDRDEDYVESDGTQVIDLGYPLTSDMEIELDYMPLEESEETVGRFGARSGADIRNISLGLDFMDFCESSRTPYRLVFSYTPANRYVARWSATQRVLTKSDSDAEVGKEPTPSPGTFSTALNATLFGINGTDWPNAKMRVYSLKIMQGGALVHSYVPTEKNGRVGLLDLATGGYRFPDEGGNPLIAGLGIYIPRSEFSSKTVKAAAPGSYQIAMGPLRPGTQYGWRVVADNGLGLDSSSVQESGVCFTASDSVPPGATMTLTAYCDGRETDDGTLPLTLIRTDIDTSEDVRVVFGSTYGGGNLAAWQGSSIVGRFATGESMIRVVTSLLPSRTRFLRAYTEGGEWSRTICMPETMFVPRKQGLKMILR